MVALTNRTFGQLAATHEAVESLKNDHTHLKTDLLGPLQNASNKLQAFAKGDIWTSRFPVLSPMSAKPSRSFCTSCLTFPSL